MTTFKGDVPAIHCDGCANSIKRSLGKLPGVTDVTVDVKTKSVTVQYNEATVKDADIRTRLEAAGFPVEK